MKIRTRLFCLGIISITIITSVILTGCQSSVSRARIGYGNFPPDLRPVLDERTAELKTKGGICIAGKVTFSDKKPIQWGQDVQVNYYGNGDVPLRVYKDGWFIMSDVLSHHYAGPGKEFILRAFGYDPIDTVVDILNGEITYLSFVMQKTPPEKLATVKGIIYDENEKPIEGAQVSLSFPFSNYGSGNMPYRIVITNSSGRFEFEGLSATKHNLTASVNSRSHHSASFTPQPGQTVIENRKLYPKMGITIDYIYQPDGSRDFTGDTLQKGTMRWIVGIEGANFSRGQIEMYTQGNPHDLNLRQDQNALYFQNSYVGPGHNGFYDAGPVEFDSVAQADGGNIYSPQKKECIAGHVYVIRTYKGHYAKLIVRSIDIVQTD